MKTKNTFKKTSLKTLSKKQLNTLKGGEKVVGAREETDLE